MKHSTHGEYLTKLTRLPHVFPVNAYLVREDDGLTLIDTAIGGSADSIMAVAGHLGLPIRRIVLTHAHGDHVGSVDALHARLPDAEVAISARDARFLTGDRTLDQGEPQVKPRGSYKVIQTQPTRLLHPEDRVGSLQVVASPGHTPGHIAFFDTRDGTLVAGDAFQTRGGLAVSGVVRPLFPFPAMGTWHKPSALTSARSLRALQPARLAVGHGDVLENPSAALDRAIEVAAEKFGEEMASVA